MQGLPKLPEYVVKTVEGEGFKKRVGLLGLCSADPGLCKYVIPLGKASTHVPKPNFVSGVVCQYLILRPSLSQAGVVQ